MSIARLKRRLELAEAKARINLPNDTIRVFHVEGGNGRGPSGHDGDLSEFLASQGYDMSWGKCVIRHICPPWNGETRTFTPSPLVDLTAKYGRAA